MTSDIIKSSSENVIAADFAHKKISTKQRPYRSNSLDRLMRDICKEVRHHKLSYEQLKSIFKEVRVRCDIETPRTIEKLIQLPTAADLEKYFSFIDDPIHKLIFKTLLGTGLRISEICALEVRTVNLAENTAFIKEGKGGKDRIVVFGHNLKNQLELYLAGRNNRYLFESSLNTKFSSRRIQQLALFYSGKSGVKINPHLLRHIFATRLAERSLTEDQRSVLCGHSKNSKVQQTYTHLSLAGVKVQAIEALDSFDL